MKHGTFNMILKANDDVMETANITMTQESTNVEITIEASAPHFLKYQGDCLL
jgi:alpha/beta superfamily hydrolase